MEENTNKAIVVNTVVLYFRLAISIICGLLTTRFALKALGVSDFGLFSVVGGVISFVALLNTIMLSTSKRYIATAIGKKDDVLINKQFNVNLVIHAMIAIVTLIVAYPLGDWYILHHVNFDGDINLAVMVFNITIIGSIISFVGVPYHGMMLARERFVFFSIIDIIFHVLKLMGAISILYFFVNKLLIYTIIITTLSALPTFVYMLYCNKHFKKYTKIKLVRDWQMYREVFDFSIWVGYGAVATICKNQGAALIVNKFFNTVMNTALGVANSVNAIIQNVAYNIGKPMVPQITKSYAAGDMKRSENLAIACSKYTFLLLLLTASPFFVETEFILRLWLGEVPPYSVLFVKLLIIDALIISLNAGIPELIFASGKIKWYQIIVNSLLLVSVVVGFFVLKSGAPAYYLQITYIVFSVIILVIRQIVLNVVIKFNNWRLIKESYVPCAIVSGLFVVFIQFRICIHPVLNIILALLFVLAIITFVGLRRNDRKYMLSLIRSIIKRN